MFKYNCIFHISVTITHPQLIYLILVAPASTCSSLAERVCRLLIGSSEVALVVGLTAFSSRA